MADEHADALIRTNRYLETDGDVEAGHERLKQAFLLMPPDQRAHELKAWDAAMEEHHRPTRAYAEMIVKQRELRDIHFAMLKVGR